MLDSTAAIRFLESLHIPQGPSAGKPLRLAPFQRQFVKGALAPDVNVGALSVGRGGAKTALSAGIALGALTGAWDKQPQREILIAARTRDQGSIAMNFCVAFLRSLPEDMQRGMIVRRSPRLEIEFEGDGGGHFLRAIAADGKSALGTAPNLVLMDERGHWAPDQGDALEHALMSGMGKRGGRSLIISTSADSDNAPFSKWLDCDEEGVYSQEHRPAPGLPMDDLASLKIANPGALAGIGSSIEWLQGQARRAMQRGGSTASNFRLYNRNERISGETRDVLLTVDEWQRCEVSELPPRVGPLIVGVDLGGSTSMSAAAMYWPESGRLECVGTFANDPDLGNRGAADGVSDRYLRMAERGELNTMGGRIVPVSEWLSSIMALIDGYPIAALTADRFRQAEFEEALSKAGIRAPVVYRGMGYRDGGEDAERTKSACFDGKVKTTPSLLLQSAIADTVVLRDPANNLKIAKARSKGKIDAVAAMVLAVAEGQRIVNRPKAKPGRIAWG